MIQVIDLGISNLKSLTSAINQLGKPYELVQHGSKLRQDGSPILLPGNGNFGKACEVLLQRDLVTAIMESHLVDGSKIIGICLGMQLMFNGSEESSEFAGLGFLDGVLRNMSQSPEEIVPVLGWRKVSFVRGLEKLSGWYYFAHSFGLDYSAQPFSSSVYSYYGRSIVSSVMSNSLLGFQFHPEKSGPLGMKLLASVLSDA
jgi:imidazole glycerol phosphate synthase glutamine amidotransferase subunit